MNINRLRESIQEIARRRNNVTLGQIEWVMDRLNEMGYKTRRRQAKHGVLCGVESFRFMVNYHNPGNKQVKPYSVDGFVNAMIELGLYEEEPDEGDNDE